MKTYNYLKILNKVKKIVLKANNSKNNKYGPTVWDYHLKYVAEYAIKLAKELKADKEIVELSAYLHDYAAMIDIKNASKHHIVGAEEAKKILKSLSYPEDKTKRIANCILNHRSSVRRKRNAIEEKIIASADAMAHFACIPDMYLLAYTIHGYETYEGALWLKEKLERDWKKIMPEGRKMIKDKKELFYKTLNQVLK